MAAQELPSERRLAHQGNDDIVQHRPEACGRGEGGDDRSLIAGWALLKAIHKEVGVRLEQEAEDISLDVTAGGVERFGHVVKLPLRR